MTYEEARQSIIEDGINLGCYGDFIDPEALPVAVEALQKVEQLEKENKELKERQTPKKPILKEYHSDNPYMGTDRHYHCPICGGSLRKPYPCVCGQRIDWSD